MSGGRSNRRGWQRRTSCRIDIIAERGLKKRGTVYQQGKHQAAMHVAGHSSDDY